MTDVQVVETIKEYLAGHKQFALATNGDHPWIATMFYGSDAELHIYFLTDPETIHAKGLNQNPLVSAVIADSPQDPGSKKKGIQLYGHASEIVDEQEMSKAFDVWCRVLKVTDSKYSVDGVKSGKLKYRIYKLVPKKIKYYNEELWDDNEKTIDL